jgi:hypothetical protein
MLGSSLLAAPIYRPGVEHRAVYCLKVAGMTGGVAKGLMAPLTS